MERSEKTKDRSSNKDDQLVESSEKTKEHQTRTCLIRLWEDLETQKIIYQTKMQNLYTK